MLQQGTIVFEDNNKLDMFALEFNDIDILNLQILI